MSREWLVHWPILRYVSIVLTSAEPPYCRATVSPWSWNICVMRFTASESKGSRGWWMTPSACSWWPSAALAITNWAALVRLTNQVSEVLKLKT